VRGLKLGAIEQPTAAQHADCPLWQVVIPTRVQNAALGLEDNLAGAFEGEAKLAADAGVGRAGLAQGECPLAQGGGLGFAAEAPFGGGRRDGDAMVHPYFRPQREKFLAP
jgi:hypothetical protein